MNEHFAHLDYAEHTTALASLLHALAEAAAGLQGRSAWNSLASLIDGHEAEASSERRGSAELSALRDRPGDFRRAERLAQVIRDRAKSEAEFQAKLEEWLAQGHISAMARAVGRSQAQAGGAGPVIVTPAGAKPPGSGEEGGTGDQDQPSSQAIRSFVSSLWTITIFGGAVAGLIVWAVTAGLGSDASPPAHPAKSGSSAGASSPQPPNAGAVIAGTAANSPARVEAVAPINTEPDGSRVLAKPVQLSPGQLSQIRAFPPAALDPVAADGGFINVTVTGNASAVVTIANLVVRKQCTAPLTGTLFFSPSSGVNGTIKIGFDLDSAITYGRSTNGYTYTSDSNYFQSDVVTLAPGETQTFSLSVRSALHYCTFTFLMSVVTPTGTVTEVIDNNGKPFQITGELAPARYRKLYVGGLASMTPPLNANGAWVQQNPKTYRG